MGRTSKWLRIFLGGKKEPKRDTVAEKQCHGNRSESTKEKRRWSFGKSSRDRLSTEEPSCLPEVESEKSKHAIAVAAVTAAAADAAMAAAHAAAAAVRLAGNSHGYGLLDSYGVREQWAAIKIQSAFRGYLARKALRALKALVRLQALVRGFLVRRQANATLYCMQSLIRVQARARAHRVSNSERVRSALLQRQQQQQRLQRNPDYHPRVSLEGGNLYNHDNLSYTQSRRGFSFQQVEMEDTAKVVEMDTYRPKGSSSRRRNVPTSESGTGSTEQSVSSSVSPLPHYLSHSSLCIPSPASEEPSTPLLQDLSPMTPNGDWAFSALIRDYKHSSLQNSPRFCSAAPRNAISHNTGPLTPSKAEVAHHFQGHSGFRNYMSNTESSKAKVRSQSAPKQRPHAHEKSYFPVRKKVPLQDVTMQSRSSFSGVTLRNWAQQCEAECKDHLHNSSSNKKIDGSTMSFRDTSWERFQSFW